QATKIAVALSPVFATQNAQWAAIHAKYTSEKQALYPAVSGNATIGRGYANGNVALNRSVTVPTSTPITTGSGISNFGTTSTETASLTISQLIFDGGRTIAAIHSAKSADYAGRATLIRNLETLELNVANSYYGVLQANATVVADAQLVKEFEVNELSVIAQIRNGAAARSDLAGAQFQTAQARGNLVTAQGQAISAQAAFATTMGVDADALVVPKPLGSQPAIPNPTYARSLTRAFVLRPDYIAAQQTVESDKEGLRYAKLARFPILTAAVGDNLSRNYAPFTNGFENQKTVGLNLAIPIYDQGVTNYNVAVAAATLDQAIAALNQSHLQVESDVRSALASLISARALLVQTNAELNAARVSLDATQAQYRVGATTIINVVTAEANLATAQSDQIKALYGVQTAQQNYLYATGISDLQL
ncbi:MAG: TolC family protein, partial [Candidatus Eremiobacteraeota bacterium]|nr:TolC family protein [Candidatus Eremiobacteraeota bacterium]